MCKRTRLNLKHCLLFPSHIAHSVIIIIPLSAFGGNPWIPEKLCNVTPSFSSFAACGVTVQELEEFPLLMASMYEKKEKEKEGPGFFEERVQAYGKQINSRGDLALGCLLQRFEMCVFNIRRQFSALLYMARGNIWEKIWNVINYKILLKGAQLNI